MINNGSLNAWLAEMHHALKPKGVLGIEQHRAPADANPTESAKKGYVPEKWLIEQVEAAGFKLAGKSEINANPKDTKDYEGGVWTLPPSLSKKDKDRDKYVAIGESDRMTLKFVKAPAKAASAPKADGDKGKVETKADKAATDKAAPKAEKADKSDKAATDKAAPKAETKSDKPPAKAEPKANPGAASCDQANGGNRFRHSPPRRRLRPHQRLKGVHGEDKPKGAVRDGVDARRFSRLPIAVGRPSAVRGCRFDRAADARRADCCRARFGPLERRARAQDRVRARFAGAGEHR